MNCCNMLLMGNDNDRNWTFLTNHGHVLLCISRNEQIRARDIAEQVGITERATQRIIADLVASGYITIVHEGRRNRYILNDRLPLRHPVENAHLVGELLHVLMDPKSKA